MSYLVNLMELVSSFTNTSIFLFLIPLILIIHIIRNNKRSGQTKLPPGPRKLPLIGNLHQLGSSLPHVALKELAEKHGPLMHLKLGELSTIVVSTYKMLQEVMKASDVALENRPEILVSKMVAYNSGDIAFLPYGDLWKQMRKICAFEVLSLKRVQLTYPLMEEEVSRMIKSIYDKAPGTPVNMTECFYSLTCNIICRASVGMACKNPDKLIAVMKKAVAVIAVFNISDLYPSLKFLPYISGSKYRLAKLHKEIDRILEEIVCEHEASIVKSNGEPMEEDLLHLLLRIRDRESQDYQIPLTRDNIKGIVLDMFNAGTEASATVLEWAMSELAKNPTIMKKVQAEVRETVKGKKNVDHIDVQKMKYLKLVIKETLRLHPPGPLALPRESRGEWEVHGYVIPNKTMALVNIWAMGRDPEYWRDPEKFEPERFNRPEEGKGIPPEFLGFGFGKRVCPGMCFGGAVAELALANALHHFDWKLPNSNEELDMTENFGGAASRKNSLYLIASPYDN